MDMTKAEKEALIKKMDNPEIKVACPRCGKNIIYKKIGNSIIVKCESNNCIEGSLRGM